MLNPEEFLVFGVDVSKDELVLYDGSRHYRVKNERGLKELSKLIRKRNGGDFGKVIISFEPTGGYSYHLLRFCSERKIKIMVVNPYKSSHFSKTQRPRGKNDEKDAVNLRKLVFVNPEEIREARIDERLEMLNSLITLYDKTEREITSWQRSLKHRQGYYSEEQAEEIKGIKKVIKVLRENRERILRKINEEIGKDEELRKKREVIRSMKGVGEIVSIVLLNFFLKYPEVSRTKITSLSGLDIVSSSSGRSIKKRGRISKMGNKLVRRKLFMSAMYLIQTEGRFRRFYEELRRRGKPKKVALTAIMRKVLVLTYSLYKNMSFYSESYNV